MRTALLVSALLAASVLVQPPQSTLPTGKEPPQSTLESSGRKYLPKTVTQPEVKVVRIPQPLPRGYHEHQCPYCKTRWGHGSASAGNQAEHTCPNCNRVLPLPWWPLAR